jgi:glutaredoxin
VIALLTRLRGKRPKRLSQMRVVVYTRAQCCCCHKAIDLLAEYRKRHGFTIETVDVDNDPALAEKYGLSVPVVAIDGKVRFKGVVNPVLLDRLIAAGG